MNGWEYALKRKIVGKSKPVYVENADLANANHVKAIRRLLSEYMSDPMGGKLPPHSSAKHKRMIVGLRSLPTAVVLLAYCSHSPVGLAICFKGFSTFQAAPLMNIHDIIVSKTLRGNGIGKRLLDEIEDRAVSTGCCKITLEVRRDNRVAQSLYRRTGFSGGKHPMDFMTKSIC